MMSRDLIHLAQRFQLGSVSGYSLSVTLKKALRINLASNVATKPSLLPSKCEPLSASITINLQQGVMHGIEAMTELGMGIHPCPTLSHDIC